MALYKRGGVWWYKFRFANSIIRESAKTDSKTVARLAESKRRRQMEEGYNDLGETNRADRIQSLKHVAEAYLVDYALRHKSVTFMRYALGHVIRLAGNKMLVDINDRAVKAYQSARIRESAAPKSINEEIGVLLRLLGEPGQNIRARMRRDKSLKLAVPQNVGKAYTTIEKSKLLAQAKLSRSSNVYPALMLALNTAMRDAEIRNLTWKQLDFSSGILTVGKSKTAAGEGRTIPMNTELLQALREHEEWFVDRFGRVEAHWHVFPFGKSNSLDPTRPLVTLKTAWINVRRRAGVTGRWHDARHTLITELCEEGAGDQTIMDIAGHVSRQMLSRYSHIGMEAKRKALQSVGTKRTEERTGS